MNPPWRRHGAMEAASASWHKAVRRQFAHGHHRGSAKLCPEAMHPSPELHKIGGFCNRGKIMKIHVFNGDMI